MSAVAPNDLLNSFPFGIILAQPIRDSQGAIVNFRLCCFNDLALQDLPALQDWHEEATLWELFPADARNGLFETYLSVCQTGLIHDEVYQSPTTGKSYYALIEPFDSGILAMGVPLEAIGVRQRVTPGRDHPRPIGHYICYSLLSQVNEAPAPEIRLDEAKWDVSLLLGRYRRVVYEKFYSFFSQNR